MMLFKDRIEAGRMLGEELKKLKIENPVVLAMPRGGVPVGFEIAKILNASLDVIIARKIGAPNQKELGIGAIAEDDIKVWDQEILNVVKPQKAILNKIVKTEQKELERRKNLYRDGKPIIRLRGKTVILVDDGVATGITAVATINAIRKLKPKKIIFAAPTCAKDSVLHLKPLVDDFLCLITPSEFQSVGQWYDNFEQVTDEEVKDILKKNNHSLGVTP